MQIELGIELNYFVCYDLRCWVIWISGTALFVCMEGMLNLKKGGREASGKK
jgi:hypothetical protein